MQERIPQVPLGFVVPSPLGDDFGTYAPPLRRWIMGHRELAPALTRYGLGGSVSSINARARVGDFPRRFTIGDGSRTGFASDEIEQWIILQGRVRPLAGRIPPAACPVRLFSLESVCAIVTLTRWTIERRIADGRFPRPLACGAVPRWLSSELETWIAERIATRGTPAATLAPQRVERALIPVLDVLTLTELSRGQILALVKAGAFPAPHGNRTKLWDSDELATWIAGRTAERA